MNKISQKTINKKVDGLHLRMIERIRRSTLFILALLLSFAMTLPAFAGEHGKRPYAIYTDYRDIPGVTSADIEAVEGLKTAFDSFEYGAGGSNETFVLDDDGSIGGFSRYFCDWLTDLFDTPFNLSIHRLANLSTNVMDGTVDFTCEFAPTDEMQRHMAMTGTIVKRAVTRFRMAGSEPPSVIAMNRPLRYGFVQWYQTADLVDVDAVETFEAFYFQRREDAITALRAGEIDAFVMDSRGEAAFNQFGDIVQEDFFPLAYSNASFATANPDLVPIVDVVQKFLETEDAKLFLSDMYERGEREFRRNNFRRMLSANEKKFIGQHVESGLEITFAAEHHSYPVSFYNQREGELQGIAIDVLREVSSLSGLTFKPMTPGSGKWADLRELFDRGGVDVVTELIYTRKRRNNYLWTDTPYDTQHFALLSHIDTPAVPYEKIADVRVGAVRASAFEEIFHDFFPNHERLTLYDGTEEAIEALGAGEIDLYMGSGNHLLLATNYLERPDFKINIAFNRICESAFGFVRDQYTLRSIVSKAQKLVDTGGISRKWKQRAFDYRRRMLEAQIPYHIAFAASMLLAVATALYLFLINERIRKGLSDTVARRTQELQLQTIAAQNASHAKSEFLARMSHEMRTPLNAITGMANIVRNTDDIVRSDESAEKIERASKQLRTIIDDILKLSRIDSETQDVSRADFEIRKMLEATLGLADTLAREKFQTIVLDVSDDIPDIAAGDGFHIGQVLYNLLSNAIKFSPQGEDIQLRVYTDPAWTTQDSLGLRFDVVDHGVGISDAEQRRLFHTFEQLAEYKDRRHGGIGVGLAISKRLVEMMGGEVEMASKPGEGSTFSFVVPVSRR